MTRRIAAIIILLVAASILTGCSGKATGATALPRDKFTPAGQFRVQFSGVGTCDSTCSAWFDIWGPNGLRISGNDAISNIPRLTKPTRAVQVLYLTPGRYTYRFCGREQTWGQNAFVCVGPDGTTQSHQVVEVSKTGVVTNTSERR